MSPLLADFGKLCLWLVAVELLALLLIPFTRNFFDNLIDRGDSLARIGGITIFAWLAWWAAWLRLAPFSRVGLRGLLLVLLVVWLILFIRRKITIAFDRQYFLSLWLFVSVAIFFAWVVGLRAAIYDTEKVSDFHFLHACMDSVTIPPPDTWFAGQPINYYYFGYTIFAALGLLTGIDAPIVYNLAVLLIPALAAAVLYSLAGTLCRKRRAGLLAVVVALLFGNLHGVQDWWQNSWGGDFSFWSASRAVSNTITEFPFFSAYLGDLHPHYMALPWFLVSLVVGYQLFYRQKVVWLAAFSLGLAYCLNTWNFPVLGIFFWLIFTILQFRRRTNCSNKQLFRAAFMGGIQAVLWGAVGLLLFLPFIYSYRNPGGAPLRWLPREVYTDLGEFLMAWGLLWVPLLIAYFYRWIHMETKQIFQKNSLQICLVLIGGLSLMLYKPSIPLLLMLVILFGLLTLQTEVLLESSPEKIIHGLLITIAALLGVFMELFFFDDLYDNKNFIRGNTVFKFSYLYFCLLPPLVSYLLWKNPSKDFHRRKKYMVYSLLGVLMACGLVYPICTLHTAWRYNQTHHVAWTLDGSAFLKNDSPQEWALMQWLRNNLWHTNAIILEKPEMSHSWGGRLAAFSGVNSALNWATSQAIWRGKFQEKWDLYEDLQAIYQGGDNLRAFRALHDNRISHIIVTPYEQRSYGIAGTGFHLDYKYPLVYNVDGIKVYQVRNVQSSVE